MQFDESRVLPYEERGGLAPLQLSITKLSA